MLIGRFIFDVIDQLGDDAYPIVDKKGIIKDIVSSNLLGDMMLVDRDFGDNCTLSHVLTIYVDKDK